MYKTKYKPIAGLPLTETIPLLLAWRAMSPARIEEDTGGAIKQANLHRICTGTTVNPGRGVVARIAEYFGLTFTQIYDADYVRAHIAGDGNVEPLGEQQMLQLLQQLEPGDFVAVLKDVMPRLSPEQRVAIAKLALDGLPVFL